RRWTWCCVGNSSRCSAQVLPHPATLRNARVSPLPRYPDDVSAGSFRCIDLLARGVFHLARLAGDADIGADRSGRDNAADIAAAVGPLQAGLVEIAEAEARRRLLRSR